MKKIIFTFSLTAALLSCKKDKTTDFTATDVTGTSVVKGNANKNIVTPNGSGGWSSASTVPAANVNVTVKINKNELYPNSNAAGADVYSGTTDNNGNYNIPVKTNASGVEAMITIDGFTGTLDTVINGVSKPGLYATYGGTNLTRTLYMGQNVQVNHNFTAQNITTNPNNTNIVTGTAIITGSISMTIIKEFSVGANPIQYSAVNVPVPANNIVHLSFTKDPTLLATKSYTAATDANGYYTFIVSTVAPNTPGFAQNATIYVTDLAATRDTIKLNGTRVPGPAGVYEMKSINETGIYNNTIRNGTHLFYSNFTSN